MNKRSFSKFLVCIHLLNLAFGILAINKFPFFNKKENDGESAIVISVKGCNNDCDIACCYCHIEKQPPLCLRCCLEDP
ncbi:hypothetical protein V2J09_019547 [Rumex salicifolius]